MGPIAYMSNNSNIKFSFRELYTKYLDNINAVEYLANKHPEYRKTIVFLQEMLFYSDCTLKTFNTDRVRERREKEKHFRQTLKPSLNSDI